MWVKLGNFSFLIIDEIFMVGVDYLYIVYRCLLEIMIFDEFFGGILVLVVGDFF